MGIPLGLLGLSVIHISLATQTSELLSVGSITRKFQRLARNKELETGSHVFDALLDCLPAISSGDMRLDPLKEVFMPDDLEVGDSNE